MSDVLAFWDLFYKIVPQIKKYLVVFGSLEVVDLCAMASFNCLLHVLIRCYYQKRGKKNLENLCSK